MGAASRFVGRGCEARRFLNAGDPAVLAQVLTARTPAARTPAVCDPADLVPTALDLVVLAAPVLVDPLAPKTSSISS